MPIFKRKEFGGLLKKLRNEHGWSQDELAEKLEVSRQTIAYTENGSNVPKAIFIEKAYKIFRSTDLVKKYLVIQEDRKELISLAKSIHSENYSLAIQIMKKVIRNSLLDGDLRNVALNLFQVVIWDLNSKGMVNRRKIQWLTRTIEAGSWDADQFLELLDDLFDISKKTKNFDAFIDLLTVTETRIESPWKLSQLLFKGATANYKKGCHDTAYRYSNRAIEKMAGTIYVHTANTHHRHSMICLQLGFYKEALEHANKALEILSESDVLYKLVKQGIARLYYMNKKYSEAKELWKEIRSKLGRDDVEWVHSLNDIIMMEIKTGNLGKAAQDISECKRLLEIARKKEWSHYDAEELLLRRGQLVLDAVITGNYVNSELVKVIDDLKQNFAYLKDECILTETFILERLFQAARMKITD